MHDFRINVESKCLRDPRIKRAAEILDWTFTQMLGTLILLWAESQSYLCTQAKPRDIIRWSGLHKADKKAQEQFLEVLTGEGLLQKIRGSRQLKISGNEDQIRSIKKSVKWMKLDETKTDSSTNVNQPEQSLMQEKQNSSEPAGIAEEKSRQCKAKQCNAIQDNKRDSGEISDPTAEPAPAAEADASTNSLTITQKKAHKGKKSAASEKQVPKKWQALEEPRDRELAEEWLAYANTVTPNNRYNADGFTAAITKMRVDYGLTHEQVQYMIRWIPQDNFWKDKALSPESMLKPSNSDPGLTKLHQLIKQIKHQKKSPEDAISDMADQLEAEGFFDEMARRRAEGVLDAVAVGV